MAPEWSGYGDRSWAVGNRASGHGQTSAIFLAAEAVMHSPREQSSLIREHDRLNPVPQPELVQDVANVSLDCPDA